MPEIDKFIGVAEMAAKLSGEAYLQGIKDILGHIRNAVDKGLSYKESFECAERSLQQMQKAAAEEEADFRRAAGEAVAP